MLVAIFGFVMAACGDDDSSDEGLSVEDEVEVTDEADEADDNGDVAEDVAPPLPDLPEIEGDVTVDDLANTLMAFGDFTQDEADCVAEATMATGMSQEGLKLLAETAMTDKMSEEDRVLIETEEYYSAAENCFELETSDDSVELAPGPAVDPDDPTVGPTPEDG